ncbi:MAG: hypothetical protein O3B22_02405 [Proteobacteria bacterium]|nr:hypothetical protein [Pseudomonadota bacterium]MDA1070259.1 hypothetical protein [Pseudomonadota bacterium]
MTVASRTFVLVSALALLAACETADETLFPSLTGEDPAGAAPQSEMIAIGGDDSVAVEQLGPLGVDQPVVVAGNYGNTGTVVSQKVRDIAGELETLQRAVNQNRHAFNNQIATTEQNAQRYYATIAAIMARLQIGTTPGNPVLVSQFDVAQTQLEQLVNDVAAFNTLGSAVASNAATSSYLSNAIDGTLRLSGAVEEDHRQLQDLDDLNDRAIVSVERTMGNLNAVVKRQTNYVNTERTRLAQLALAISNGRLYGPALADMGTQQAPAIYSGEGALAGRQALVVIRFDRPNVAYQEPLYQAVSAALERKPSAVFDLVAVAPAGGSAGDVALAGNQVKRSAEDVLRTLTEMGLPSDRVSISATTSFDAQANEVRIFVR